MSGLLEAVRMIKFGGIEVVAVVAGDAVASMPTDLFLQRADQGCKDPEGKLPSPVIPHGYDRIAKWQMDTYGVTREQLAMCSVLMSQQAVRHPFALTKEPRTLEQVLTSKPIAPNTSLLECARRADGGAAIIVASSRFMRREGKLGRLSQCPVVVAGGEASGPLYPPKVIDEEMFSCEVAVQSAYEEAQLGPSDIDFFALYDCYPICLIRALEATGLAGRGQGGKWIEEMYKKSLQKTLTPNEFRINTHGGLLAFGAPWEVPAMYNIIEAVEQINGSAKGRQIDDVRRALVYGNGGIFSASAVAILGNGKY